MVRGGDLGPVLTELSRHSEIALYHFLVQILQSPLVFPFPGLEWPDFLEATRWTEQKIRPFQSRPFHMPKVNQLLYRCNIAPIGSFPIQGRSGNSADRLKFWIFTHTVGNVIVGPDGPQDLRRAHGAGFARTIDLNS
jgi:hypothetical protein